MNSELNAWTFSAEPDFSFLTIKGADAETFLQGLTTQNIKTMTSEAARWCAATNHQGRVASSSLIIKIPGGFGLLMPSEVASAEAERLGKFVFRSKVEISVAPDPVLYFHTSDKAAAQGCPAFPAQSMGVHVGGSVIIVRLASADTPSGREKFIAIGHIPDSLKMEPNTSGQLTKSLMEEGVYLIGKDEMLEWLPQALNLDLIGAVAPRKGCYIGQEVINKTQSLGKVRRRMFLGSCPSAAGAQAGAKVFAAGEAVGTLLLSEKDRFLFVLQWNHKDDALTLNRGAVKILSLPYELTVPESVL